MKHLPGLLFAALLAASSPAAAGSLTIGVPVTGTQVVLSSLSPTNAQCQPFGCPQAILTNSGGAVNPLSWTQNFSRSTVLSRSPLGQRPSPELFLLLWGQSQ